MLSPDQLSTLLELLEPPAGFELDAALATTYTLDLDALLTAPTAFAITNSVSEAQLRSELTPLELLDALRTQVGKVTVCCDASGIKLPSSSRSGVMSFLEKTIVPVRAPRGGVFHPKVWVIRFSDPADQTHHRLLISSRNLTFDRSWDTVISLEEDPSGVALPALGGFVAGLASEDVVVGALPERHRDRLESLGETAGRARYAIPPGFDDMKFHSLGQSTARASRSPFPTAAKSALIVSPFLTLGFLEGLPTEWDSTTVVSRPDEIERVLGRFSEDEHGPNVLELNPSCVEDAETESSRLRGLHAKVFVLDETYRRSRVYAGSANATTAAFRDNVEVLLELTGSTGAVGVDTWLKGDDCLNKLLKTHVWGSAEAEEDSSAQIALDNLRRDLSQRPVVGTVVPADGGRHRVTYLLGTDGVDLTGVRFSVRPLSIKTWTSVIEGGNEVAFELETVALTSFLGARLELDGESCEFLLVASLIGVPEDRDARIVAALLADPERLIRYLLMLLFDPAEDRFDGNAQEALEKAKHATTATLSTLPLLEVMARALTRQRSRLSEIDRLLRELEDTSDLVDPDLRALWASVREAAGLSGVDQ